MLSGQLFSCTVTSLTSHNAPTHTLFLSARFLKTSANSTLARWSLGCRELSSQPPLELQCSSGEREAVETGDEEISGIQVPRQRYISVPKSELLDAILLMFDMQEDIHHFRLVSSCLDSILHAEHKRILEEMRIDYCHFHAVKESETIDDGSFDSEMKVVGNWKESDSHRNNTIDIGSTNRGKMKFELDRSTSFNYGLDLRLLLGSVRNVKGNNGGNSRVVDATRFQHAFMQLLRNAQFEELSARDLMLTSALNTDYLLTLPIYVDWKRASESNAIIFRRGYATERQKGLLIVEKLDYLQSKLLQRIFSVASKPLGKFGIWINEVLKSALQTQEVLVWTGRMKFWLKTLFKREYTFNEQASDSMLGVDQLSETDSPIWLAAQKAVTRYEGLLSSVGPRGRLLRKLLVWIGLVPSTPEMPFELDAKSASENFLRSIFLPRISLNDIWRPATRKYCQNDLWKMLKTSVSIIFSKSILQEPAFQELILLYTEEVDEIESEDGTAVPSLRLKIYERIPIPDLPVIFPHKKLSFRIIDTVRLDVATLLGLLAFFVNYKFEDILSSPSAILLDAIAISSLILYVTRVVLGYKQTWDRYQLLVNRTLNEKTLASGFGSVHFLVDASEQQQYKEAILAYAILLKGETGQVSCHRSVGARCERFMHDMFEEKVEMPVEKAIDTLKRLGLVVESSFGGKSRLQAIPCAQAYQALRQHWNSLLR